MLGAVEGLSQMIQSSGAVLGKASGTGLVAVFGTVTVDWW